MAILKTFVQYVDGLRIHSCLMNCFNLVIILRFYNELKFHICLEMAECPGYHPV